MIKLKSILFLIFFISALSNDLYPEIIKSEMPAAERKIKLKWVEVDGALGYKVMVKNIEDNVIVDQEVSSNSIVLEIPPGDYKIRIGPINKFSKLGNWSDWADLSIEKPEPKEKKKKEESQITKTDLFDMGLKIGIGMSYFYILPEWNEYYKNTYNAFSIDVAYSFRKTSFPGFLKYMGVDVESSYFKFDGKKTYNRVDSNITDIFAGANVFLSTNFSFPLNFALRGGGGITYTVLEFQKYDASGYPIEKGTATTLDFYYKGGLSAEYRFYSCFYIEVFADYYNINYLVNDFKTLRIACLLGIRF